MSTDSVSPPTMRSAGLSLVFAPGQRPAGDDVVQVLEAPTDYAQAVAVSQRPPSAGRIELFAAGLTFELSGLAPSGSAPVPDIAHWYGFATRPPMASAEAILLSAGQDSHAATTLLLVRTMVGVASRLAQLPHVIAVVWQPARSAMAPSAFIAAIDGWLQHGPFPAIGLTALYRDDNGAIRSEGLAFFTGQELLIEPALGITTAQDARIAARLINHLVGSEAINKPFQTMGPNGEQLSVYPPGSDGFLRVWRKS